MQDGRAIQAGLALLKHCMTAWCARLIFVYTYSALPPPCKQLPQAPLPHLQKFSNHDLVKYLESIGADFGACQNACTTADDTVYEFMLPVQPDVLEQSFEIFAEFACRIR